jgi:hypothetical protein
MEELKLQRPLTPATIIDVGQVQELRWLACPGQSQARGERSESLDVTD